MERVRKLLLILENFMRTIRIWDLLDMAIVAFLVYKLITFFNKSNSMNVVKGILFLLILMVITSAMDLPVVSYLLGNTFEMGLIIIIVLFQPEIRRILDQVGGSLKDIFGHPVKTKSIETAITQTVLACSDMSRTRTGALLVFERDTNLESYIKTGTIVDASPAAELLKNIFFDKAPLHDGAVIIRNGRIAGAACMLPLSGNVNISRDLGMRHRAGIGMSERSDAVVAIVSEETGDISVAMEGIIKRGLSPDTFERLLRMELMPAEQENKGFFARVRDVFKKNGKKEKAGGDGERGGK